MTVLAAARKTVRRLSDRVDREGHTMQFGRQPDGSGFIDHFDTWQRMKGQPESEHRALLKAMQDSCVRHNIITTAELADINTKYGVQS